MNLALARKIFEEIHESAKRGEAYLISLLAESGRELVDLHIRIARLEQNHQDLNERYESLVEENMHLKRNPKKGE